MQLDTCSEYFGQYGVSNVAQTGSCTVNMADKIAVAIATLNEIDESDDNSSDNDMGLPLMTASSLLGDEKSRIQRELCHFTQTVLLEDCLELDVPILMDYLSNRPALHPLGPGRRDPIAVNRQLLVTLWYLGGTDSITKIADRFGMSESSVISCRNRVISEILSLRVRFIVWPNVQEMDEEAIEFAKRNGFPNIVGAVDGTHIQIKAPTSHAQSYVNRKGYHSIQLQCVCWHNMAFSHVFTGYPGSCHDARILKNSDLWENGLQKCNMVHHNLGDGAYTISQQWQPNTTRKKIQLLPF